MSRFYIKNPKNFVFYIIFYGACSCSHAVIKVTPVGLEGSEKLNISSTTWDALNNSGEALGNAPVNLKKDDWNGRVLDVSSPSYSSEFWVIEEELASSYKVNLNLIDRSSNKEIVSSKVQSQVNMSHQILLKALQAVYEERYKDALALSEQLKAGSSKIASPYIIEGMIAERLENKKKAKSMYESALKIDPQNKTAARWLKSAVR